MTIFPFQFNEVMYLYNRISRLKPSTLIEGDQPEPQDKINISAEAKKRQVMEQTRNEILEKIRR
jgi:hypothetical protein